MNDPKKPMEEPRRTSNPMPGESPPMEAPPSPSTEFEHDVPHSPNQPVAMASGLPGGKGGEGSYEGTRQYDEGLEKFTKKVSSDESIKKAGKIDVNDPSLQQAEKKGREPRSSTPSMH